MKEDKVYIKNNILLSNSEKENSLSIISHKQKYVPIPSSQLVGKKGDLDIYLYPKVEFSDAGKIKVIIFMLVFQTEYGKTILFKSFINYVLRIEIKHNLDMKLFMKILDLFNQYLKHQILMFII